MLSKEDLDGCIQSCQCTRIVEIGIKLLRMKVPCVIEKPLGISLAEVNHLLEVAKERKPSHGFCQPTFHALSRRAYRIGLNLVISPQPFKGMKRRLTETM